MSTEPQKILTSNNTPPHQHAINAPGTIHTTNKSRHAQSAVHVLQETNLLLRQGNRLPAHTPTTIPQNVLRLNNFSSSLVTASFYIVPILSNMVLAKCDTLLSARLESAGVAEVFRYVDDFLVLLECGKERFDACVS